MAGDETRRKTRDDSDSEDESEDEQIVKVDIDPSKLTPLSPEVISKQVSLPSHPFKALSLKALQATINLGMSLFGS